MEAIEMKRVMFCVIAVVLMYGATCMAATGFDDVNKDVHNDTNEPAYGFRIVLKGEQNVIWNYNGYPNDWRFGDFKTSIVVEADGETTMLQWSEPLNPNGDPKAMPYCTWVHVGYRLTTHADILEACWTNESGDCISLIAQPTQIVDLEDGFFVLTIKNALRDESLVVYVDVKGYRLWDGRMGLDELNGANPELALGKFIPFSDAAGIIQLAHDESRTFTVLPLPGSYSPLGEPSVIIFKEGKDKDNEDIVTFRDFSQFVPEPPPPHGFPTVSEWGLIIMALLLVTAGAVVIVRRSKVRLA